jgi:hypothetical protein
VPNPANPQSLNRYSYILNNPLKYTDPTGHENFFGEMVGLGLTSMSPSFHFGAARSTVAFNLQSASATIRGTQYADTWVFTQVFGEKAAAYQSAIRTIAMGVAGIIAGIILFPVGGPLLIAAGVLAIISAGLTVASGAASLAGNPSLADDLGWAALGTGIAATIVGLAGAVVAEHAAPSEFPPQVSSGTGEFKVNLKLQVDEGYTFEIELPSISSEYEAAPGNLMAGPGGGTTVTYSQEAGVIGFDLSRNPDGTFTTQVHANLVLRQT